MDEIDINSLELKAEALEAYHLAMDAEGVPRHDLNGNEYSAYGRALMFAYVTCQDRQQEK